MKIILSTTPIRPVPTDYPPFGSLALIQSLRLAGYNPYFYDIDCLRPSFDDVIRFYKEQKPDLICISAVVSTAYGYTKNLCLALKTILPNTPIFLGGNLAASAELIHRYCKIDLCCTGEGERTIVNVANYFRDHPGLPLNYALLQNIQGLTFLNEHNQMINTGFEIALPAAEFLDPDFEILEKYSKMENFIVDPVSRPDFARDPRSYEPHRRGQKLSTVITEKGCVSRCTFCHRWDKGYRPFPPGMIIRRMKYLRDRYNVGFFAFSDENFGSDKEQRDELIRQIKEMDVLYNVGGVRCRTVSPEILERMKESGCVSMYYGMETGSPRLLEVMEKNATIEHNLNAALWTWGQGLYTIYQLILAMPGENKETVNETMDFVKKVTEDLPESPHKYLSVNYIQALPGTAVYEYAREKGFIEKSMDGEDRYLMQVSDVNASDDTKFINFTEYDYFTVQTWRHKILFEAKRNWLRKRGWKRSIYRQPDGAEPESKDYYTEGSYFNLKNLVQSPFYYRYFYFSRHFLFIAYVVYESFRSQSWPIFWSNIKDHFRYRAGKKQGLTDIRSLRRVVKDMTPPPATPSEIGMESLRLGR